MPKSLLSNLNRDSDGGSDPQDAVLHPLLQAALLGLDTELDQELARYRRQRSLKPRRSPRPVQRPVHEPQGRAELPALAASTAALATGLQPRQTPASPERAIAPTPAALATPGNHHLDAPVPDDYMESSEELLRSLADEAPPSQPVYEADDDEPGLIASLLTPLGIGSMLLLLLSSATLGYVILNPSLVGLPRLGQWGSDRPTAEGVVSPSSQGGIPNPNLAEEEFVNLGLDTLSTLPRTGQPTPQVSLPPTNATTPAPSTTATAVPSAIADQLQPDLTASVVVESDPSDVVYVPDPAPVAQPAPAAPAPVVQQPAPAPAPAPEVAAAPSAAPAPSNYYYVVTDYSGDRSLEDARQAVGDAYVRNFPEAGAQVQFGAFSDPDRAEALLNELASQGISAEIYRP
ncbi:MAG: SPOR domain-containing protein [Leptolyngbya sp. DLM2.Bin15]|nr:MAG: SPOR domain-containing protein [Leptolyngbya sp. DLM2.Bin15]